MSRPPETFTCIDCGGVAHLIAFLSDDDELAAGSSLAYRCSDCMERFDVIWEEGDGAPESDR